jgi:excisionase family DNA binding protein
MKQPHFPTAEEVEAALNRMTLEKKEELATWLRVGQIAARLGIASDAVRSAIRRGELPSIKHGRQLLIDPKEVSDWLKISYGIAHGYVALKNGRPSAAVNAFKNAKRA